MSSALNTHAKKYEKVLCPLVYLREWPSCFFMDTARRTGRKEQSNLVIINPGFALKLKNEGQSRFYQSLCSHEITVARMESIDQVACTRPTENSRLVLDTTVF